STHIKLVGPDQAARTRLKAVGGLGGLGPPSSWLRPLSARDNGDARGSGEAMGELGRASHAAAAASLGLFSAYSVEGFQHTVFRGLPAAFASPYLSFGPGGGGGATRTWMLLGSTAD